jgi:hypothetical protein
MEIASAARHPERSLVGEGEWQLADDVPFDGTDAEVVDYQDYH